MIATISIVLIIKNCFTYLDTIIRTLLNVQQI